MDSSAPSYQMHFAKERLVQSMFLLLKEPYPEDITLKPAANVGNKHVWLLGNWEYVAGFHHFLGSKTGENRPQMLWHKCHLL